MLNVSLSPDEKMLQQGVREFLESECPLTVCRAMEEDPIGFPAGLWNRMAELGWLALPFPESLDGAGGSFADSILLAEEMGRVLAPVPYQSSIAQAGQIILALGTEDQKREHVPRIGRGEAIVSVTWMEPGVSEEAQYISTRAVRSRDGFVITGTKVMVDWAHIATELIVLARTDDDPDDGITAFLIPRETAGVAITPMPTIAEGQRFEVTFNDVVVSNDQVLGPVNGAWKALWPARQKAILSKCAELVGMSAVAHQISLDYSKNRVAFGRPIGAFQAIQHKLVEMQNCLDGARLATYYAAWLIDQGHEDDYFVSVAKAQASEASRIICFEGHEIIAGLGFMREFDLQLFYRRCKVAEIEFGDARFHRSILAKRLRETSTAGRL